MKNLWLLPCFVGMMTSALAQTPADSLQLLNANWKTTKLKKRVIWREVHLDNLFEAKQNLNVLVFSNKGRKPTVRFGSAGDSLKITSWFGQRDKALAVVNGTFFDVKNGGSVDMIKVDGQVMDTTRYVSGKPLSEHQQSAILIRKNRVSIAYGGDKPAWERSLEADNVMVTGPLLLKDGQRHPLFKNAFNNNRHPRTCACVTADDRVMLLTADGRNTNAAGLSLPELAAVMKWLGCRDAINFDGGGSTTMWIKGMPGNGVVNYPSDSKQWIHTGERAVSNVMLIK